MSICIFISHQYVKKHFLHTDNLIVDWCNNTEREFAQDFIIINDGFTPTMNQIDKANSKLLNYLETKTKNGQTIYINGLDGKMPLEDQLKYFKRRYLG